MGDLKIEKKLVFRTTNEKFHTPRPQCMWLYVLVAAIRRALVSTV